jgi:hypothetical protein
MLVNVTFSLPEDTVKKLRNAAASHGKRRKGAISELVDAAILEHLDTVESSIARQVFEATKDGRVLASAQSLRGLAAELKKLGLDPREVMVESSTPLRPLVRSGLRGHPD